MNWVLPLVSGHPIKTYEVKEKKNEKKKICGLATVIPWSLVKQCYCYSALNFIKIQKKKQKKSTKTVCAQLIPVTMVFPVLVPKIIHYLIFYLHFHFFVLFWVALDLGNVIY